MKHGTKGNVHPIFSVVNLQGVQGRYYLGHRLIKEVERNVNLYSKKRQHPEIDYDIEPRP